MTKDEFHDKAKQQGGKDSASTTGGSAKGVIHFHAPQFSGPRAPAPRPSFVGGMPMAMNIKPLSANMPAETERPVVKKLHFFSPRGEEDSK